MLHDDSPDGEFFFLLFRIDQEMAEAARAAGCTCGGRLHRSDYARKPRGLPAPAEDMFDSRFSFCCDREGCRKRCTPASVRFLGRRVYVGATVVLACVLRQLADAVARYRALCAIELPPKRTVRRWSRWWRTAFIASDLWRSDRGRFMPPVSIEQIPTSVLERFAGTGDEKLRAMLLWLSPLSIGGNRSSDVMAG
jgi:hypothetical protein